MNFICQAGIINFVLADNLQEHITCNNIRHKLILLDNDYVGGDNIGLQVESLRIKRKLTIRGLAELSGVSKSVIGDISIGIKSKLNKDQELRLAKALGVVVSDLYKTEENE